MLILYAIMGRKARKLSLIRMKRRTNQLNVMGQENIDRDII